MISLIYIKETGQLQLDLDFSNVQYLTIAQIKQIQNHIFPRILTELKREKFAYGTKDNPHIGKEEILPVNIALLNELVQDQKDITDMEEKDDK